MHIAVCMKAVPASTEVHLDPVTHTIVREGGDAVWNPYDTAALELALDLEAKLGATVTVVSMGIMATQRLLKDARARGADHAVLLSDRAFAGSDTIATTRALAAGLATLDAADLVLCGKMAIDGDTAQIGPMLAAALGWRCVTGVSGVETAASDHVVVRQLFEDEQRLVQAALPVVLTIDKDAVQLRMPSIVGVLEAEAAPVDVLTAADCKIDAATVGLDGSPTRVVTVAVPEAHGQATRLEGTAEEVEHLLAQELKEML